MSGASSGVSSVAPSILASSLTSPISSATAISASPSSGPASIVAVARQGCNLAGLVLLIECWEGLVQGSYHLHLLGREEDLVSGLENLFVGLTVKGPVAYMSEDIHWQFHGPDG